MKKYTLLTFCTIFLFFITSCGQKFKQAEYSTVSSTANPLQESTIDLDDGASITIPSDSVEVDVTVTIERNPEKAKALPPLPDGFVQISDFYNFEISGGKLVGPVDITLPINKDLIPQKDGILVAAFPTGTDWVYRPVSAESNMVTVYTDHLGDPLIAWHFTDEKELHFCDPGIPINVIPIVGNRTDDFQIVGRLKPIGKEFLTFLGDKLASLVLGQEISTYAGFRPLEIEFNGEPSKTISATTKADGTFEVTINPEKFVYLGLKDGVNRLKVTGTCVMGLTDSISTSVGYSSFEISLQEQSIETAPAETELPSSESVTILPPQSHTDKIPIPNVVGMTFDNAQHALENLGFNITWIDGKSTLEVGQVYLQSPKAGSISVPHRTTVVLYRTTEKVEQLSECAQLNLTPEEFANCGWFTYRLVTCEDIVGDHCKNAIYRDIEVNYYLWASSGEKLGNNTYRAKIDYTDQSGNIIPAITQFTTITFTLDGAIEVHEYTNTEPNVVEKHLIWKSVHVRLSE